MPAKRKKKVTPKVAYARGYRSGLKKAQALADQPRPPEMPPPSDISQFQHEVEAARLAEAEARETVVKAQEALSKAITLRQTLESSFLAAVFAFGATAEGFEFKRLPQMGVTPTSGQPTVWTDPRE